MKHCAGPVPDVALHIFGNHLPIAVRYADILGDAGVERGLIGPREVERLWSRHVLNSAVVEALIPSAARVVDVGSGAGLPGIPLAIARPDLNVTLVEPLLRRATFLSEVIADLELHVTVIRGRAEDAAVRSAVDKVDVVVSRAVAPLDRLTRWSLPLLRPGGVMVALKGERATSEVEEHRLVMKGLGARDISVVTCGVDGLETPTTVVLATRAKAIPPGGRTLPRRGNRRPA